MEGSLTLIILPLGEGRADSMSGRSGARARELIPSVKSHWFIPYELTAYTGHVVVTFRVAKDGSIHDLAIKKPSSVIGFNKVAIEALRSVQNAPALQAETGRARPPCPG